MVDTKRRSEVANPIGAELEIHNPTLRCLCGVRITIADQVKDGHRKSCMRCGRTYLFELKAVLLVNERLPHCQRAASKPICSAQKPCCDRRDEYNGFDSGPLLFECPKNCQCHD